MNIRGDSKAQHRVMKLALGAIAFWSCTGPPTAVAAEPLALRKIMSELGANMQRVTDGLSREDYAVVEKTARAIADHPQPPVSEKTRIIGFVGGNITRFKGYDAATHDAAGGDGKAKGRTRGAPRLPPIAE